MKKLIVCGDSFLSPVLSFPGTHFSEIFSKELDFELLCYSRSGMSNAGIAIQLNTAIEKRPDLIIFNTTGFDRTEIPVKYSNEFKLHDTYKCYTVENLLYTQSLGLSSNYDWVNKNSNIWSIGISDVLSHMTFNKNLNQYFNHNAMSNLELIEDFEEKVKATKSWFNFLYDPKLKKMIDSLMMYGIMHKLHMSNIPYIWVHDSLFSIGNPVDFSWMPNKNNVSVQGGTIVYNNRNLENQDPGYHTTFEGQHKIAQFLIEHYKNNFI